MHKLIKPALVCLLVAACAQDARPSAVVPERATSPVSEPTEQPVPAAVPDTIFYNAKIITMEDANPAAEAIAIAGDRILALGTDEEVLAASGPATRVIDLHGRTIVPGFIDSHQHRIGDRAIGGYEQPDDVIQLAVEQGWTSLTELFEDEQRLAELRALDQAGKLRVRINAYLALANPQGQSYGDWYQSYEPLTEYSPFLRLAGVKLYMDHGWGNGPVLWTQQQLNSMVAEAHARGWQVASHTLSATAHTMILDAMEKSLGGAATDPYRDRIEHVIVISDADMQRMGRLGILASIQLSGPGTWMDDPTFATDVTPDLYPHFARWRDLEDAGLVVLGSSDWPYGTLEPGFGSPMLLLYQAVTRTGTDRRAPEPWMLGQELTMEQALRSLTINGAYGTFEEDEKGSLRAGKLADLVILSDSPLTAAIESVPAIEVLMTMIGGKVEHCAPGQGSICPETQAASTSAAASLFTGTWHGPDPDDGSTTTLVLVQTGNSLTGTFSDTYSGSVAPSGYEGEGSGRILSPTTAQMTFALTRWDGKAAQVEYSLTLSDQNNTLTLGCAAGCPLVLQQ